MEKNTLELIEEMDEIISKKDAKELYKVEQILEEIKERRRKSLESIGR